MKYQVCEPLTPAEYAALKADIAAHGILVSIETDEAGEIDYSLAAHGAPA